MIRGFCMVALKCKNILANQKTKTANLGEGNKRVEYQMFISDDGYRMHQSERLLKTQLVYCRDMSLDEFSDVFIYAYFNQSRSFVVIFEVLSILHEINISTHLKLT